MNNWKKIIVSSQLPILEVMKVIDSAGTQFVMVLDKEEKLLGVVTDGDIRRGILNNIALNSPVFEVMNKNPKSLPSTTSKSESFEFMKKHFLNHVPLVDPKGRVTNVLSIDERLSLSGLDNTAVLLVGGLGSRLGELTSNCPKPLLPIGGKPVLEIIIENLKEHGFRDFILCVNYRAEMIQEYFGDGSKLNVKIRYVHEQKKMGTAGALSLLPSDAHGPLLVMNGDIVTKVNFSRLIDFHRENYASATMAVRNYDFQVPFGVVKSEDGKLVQIEEKPVQSFLVSAGIYVLEKEVCKYVPKDSFFDMPQLFDTLVKNKESAQIFPIHEYWLDIGREDDLVKAHNDYPVIKGKN